MHVLVFEPRYKGHHLHYVQLVVEGLLQLGCQVTFGTGQGVPEKVEYAPRIGHLEGRIRVETVPTARPGTTGGMHEQWRLLLRRTRPDHAMVPSGDGLIQQCGLMRSLTFGNPLRHTEAEGLILQCRFAFPGITAQQRMKYALIRRFVRHSGFSRLFIIDPLAHESLQRVDPRLGARMDLLPDPLEDVTVLPRTAARTSLGIPEDGRYVGITGTLDSRKGVDRLVRAFARAHLPAGCRLLIAGIVEPDLKPTLERELEPLLKSGRAFWVNRYLSIAELTNVLSAVDLLCAPYIGHLAPSGIVVRSARIGTPVLVTDFGWCGLMVPRLGIGWACKTADEPIFAAALEGALEGARRIVPSPLLSRYFEYLAPANFTASWMKRIRERLGLPSLRVLDWNWVMHGN